MADDQLIKNINYRCAECGGKLMPPILYEGFQLMECEGCKAIYDITDPELLSYAF